MVNGSQIKAVEGSSTPPRNVLFDGVSFHDMLRAPELVEPCRLPARDGRRRADHPAQPFLELRGLRHPLHRLRRRGVAPQRAAREQLLRVLPLGLLLRPARRRPRRAWSHFELRNNTSDSSFNVAGELSGPSGSSATSRRGRGPLPGGVTSTGTSGRGAQSAAARTIASPAPVSRPVARRSCTCRLSAGGGTCRPGDSPTSTSTGSGARSGGRPDAGADEAEGCTRAKRSSCVSTGRVSAGVRSGVQGVRQG